ncbi:hypothetical protein INT47_010165 [Mucor saturninus]|uniref:Uncharacterized protein n=1 Tax=Mucor saturninus TaxID=64648 RepID=A0A8H7RBS9_9FUNG|nr:hypothetical protein INT47_010165 [Mucor saturninus]
MAVYNLHLGSLSNGLRDILAVFPTENIQQMDQIARQISMREVASLQNQTLQLHNINVIINEVQEIDITIDAANPNLLQIILRLKQELNRIDDAVVRTSTTVGIFEGVYEMYLPNLTQRLNLLLPQFEHVARLTIDTMIEHRNTSQSLHSLERRSDEALTFDPNNQELLQPRTLLERTIGAINQIHEAYIAENAAIIQEDNVQVWLIMDMMSRMIQICADILLNHLLVSSETYASFSTEVFSY